MCGDWLWGYKGKSSRKLQTSERSNRYRSNEMKKQFIHWRRGKIQEDVHLGGEKKVTKVTKVTRRCLEWTLFCLVSVAQIKPQTQGHTHDQQDDTDHWATHLQSWNDRGIQKRAVHFPFIHQGVERQHLPLEYTYNLLLSFLKNMLFPCTSVVKD